jgi:predicted nucleic acid-binding protein
MKSIFVDTNVIIDLLADRKPFSKFSVEIFELAEKKNIKLYSSTHAFATTHYILKKYIDENKLREILLSLLDYIELISIDQNMIKKGLNSRHKDFEDALQLNCAYSNQKIDCLITRNVKDFKNAEIPIFTPEEYLNKK